MEALDPKSLSLLIVIMPYTKYIDQMHSFKGQRTHSRIINNSVNYLSSQLHLSKHECYVINNMRDLNLIELNSDGLTEQVIQEYKNIYELLISNNKKLDNPIGLYNKYIKHLYGNQKSKR